MARATPMALWKLPVLDPGDEAIYAEHFAEEVRERVRLLLPIAVLLYLAFLIWDYYLDPRVLEVTVPLRFGWALLALTAWSATFARSFSRLHQWILFGVILSAGCILVSVLARLPFGLTYGAESVLLVLFFAALFHLRPLGAAPAFFAIGVWMNLAMDHGSVPHLARGVHNVHFVSGSLVAVAYTHFAEVWSRQNFVLQHQLARERDRSASLLEVVRTERQERVSWLENMARFLRHELKNQLIGIQTSLGMLRGKSAEQGARFVERAERSASVMSRIVEAATEATSLEGALREKEADEIDLAALAEDHARDAALVRSAVDIRYSGGPVRVRGDAARLVQLLDKVVQNACDHAPVGGRVFVRAGAREGIAWVRVENDGDPIVGDAELLFQPFASFRPTPVRRGDNLGLGLYVARQIARAHGGDIRVTEPRECSGAAFELSIPMAGTALASSPS